MPRTLHFPELAKRVRSQRKALPSLYGDVDFSARPYRLALDPDDKSSLPAWVADRGELLSDERTIELMSTATMLGDVVADAYAALMERQSFKSLIDMLQRACREGIDAVPDAPPELERFIAAMEQRPDWVDMDLVREARVTSASRRRSIAPFVIRGAFMATFLNTYAALPMALTGALGGQPRRTPHQRDRKLLRRDDDARRARAPRAGVRGGRDGAPHALDGPLQRAEEVRQVGPRRVWHPDPPGRSDAGRADQRLLARPPGPGRRAVGLQCP